MKKGLVEYLSFDVPNREEWNPSERTSYCFKFYITDSEEETFPNLVFQSNIWDCHGKFALDIKYRSISDGKILLKIPIRINELKKRTGRRYNFLP